MFCNWGHLEVLMTSSVEIDDELNARIRRLAEARQLPPNRLVREAIMEYADRAEARQSFLQEADASWEAFQTDGLHLTGSEVRVWLRTLAADGDAAIPECHE